MVHHRCLKIALRIDARLRAELSEGIDAERMVAEPLYARDVLLVCDAMTGSEVQNLAGLYRQAAAQDSARPLLRAPLSIGGLLQSLFGGADVGPQRGSSQAAKWVKGSHAGVQRPRTEASTRNADGRKAG
jgi:hypothetical protein